MGKSSSQAGVLTSQHAKRGVKFISKTTEPAQKLYLQDIRDSAVTQVSRQNRHSKHRAAALLCFFLSWSHGASADEMPTDWAGIRPLGMGNAFTALGNDENAVFSNPAGLAHSRNPRSKNAVHSLIFPGLVFGGNSQALQGIQSSPSKPKSYFENIIKKAQNNPGHMST